MILQPLKPFGRRCNRPLYVAAAAATALALLGAGPPAAPPGGQTPPLLDDFNRPNEGLSQGGNWQNLGGGPGLNLINEQVMSDRFAKRSYRTTNYPGDVEVTVETAVVSPGNVDGMELFCCLQDEATFGWDGYIVRFYTRQAPFPDAWQIVKVTDGAESVLAALDHDDWVDGGDRIGLRRAGAAIEGWHFTGGTWVKVLEASDGAYTSGKIGAGIISNHYADGRLDNSRGGAPADPPPPLPPPSGGPPLEQSQGICTGRGVHAIATSRCLSDPINTLTGSFVTSVEDLSVPGTGVSFGWSRSYTSSDESSGPLGPGWTHSYAVSLHVEPSGDVRLHGDEGQIVSFARQVDGSFVGAPGALSTLSAVPAGYELVRADQVIYRFDAQGRLLSTKDRNEQGITIAYDGAGRLTTITDAAERRVSLSYNAADLVSGVSSDDGRRVGYGYADGRLSTFTDVRGKTWRYTYDSGGRLATIVDPLDRIVVTNSYGTGGRVQSQTDATGKTTTFAWDAATETATVTDPRGNAWRGDYHENVLVARIDPLGNATTFDHDADLNASGVTSPTGETTSMTYDAHGNLLSATAPASLGGARKTFVYNTRNDPLQVTDARGAVTSYAYDADGNAERVVQDGTRIASYTYDEAGRVLTATDGNGETTTFAYDASGNLASEVDPVGNRTTYTYDDAGRVFTRVDPRGNAPGADPADFTWRWTYDAAGQVLTERDPLGAVTTHTYDDAGNELTVTDANGETTTSAYDAANRVISTTGPDPDGSGPLPAPVTTYTYDDAGNRVTETDGGRTTTYAYDTANRLVSTTGPDPDGAGPLPAPVTANTYDDNGNLASTVEPRGYLAGANPNDFRTSFTYDAAGRLLTTTDPLGNVTTNGYDAVGNLSSVRDANGHNTTFTHDAAGRIATVTGADGGVTAYTYDAAGNRVATRDANDHVTTYAHDAAGRLVSESLPDPDGSGPQAPAVATRSYDASGNLTSTVDPNGNSTATAGDGRTTFGYDAADRLVSIDYSDATPDVSFTYDAVGNRVSMSDGSGVETRTYDALRRLSSVVCGSNSFSYAYDAVGNLSGRTYPGGTAITYGHDGLGRIASVTSGSQTTRYEYDAASNLTRTTLPSANGHVETRAYDRAGRLIEATTRRGSTTLAGFAATLDGVGNPTRIIRTGALAQTQTFAYDPNDRIQSVCFRAAGCPGAQDPFVTWTYDRVGNRLSEQRGGAGTTSYTYDAADRLTRAGSTTYSYDENGNQLSAGSRTFTYDLANRLRTTRLGSTTTTYSYDGDGVLLQASTGSSSSQKTNFLWDINQALPQIALERNGSGSQLRRYIYGERRISMTAGSSTSYYHYDGLGSVANMTSSSGSRRWTYAYEPFGSIRTEQRSGGSAPTNFMKFTGEYLDPTGLYHLRARQYDPAIGRFLRPDPVDLAAGAPNVSSYAYAANRPTVLVDPSGETFRPASTGQDTAGSVASVAVAEAPLICIEQACVPRPLIPTRPKLVHPIPRRFSTWGGTLIHPTARLPGYPALDFGGAEGTPVVAVERGYVRRFGSADQGEALYLRGVSGIDYWYGHIRRSASVGQSVQLGQVLGRTVRYVNQHGRADHLHLGANANRGNTSSGARS